MRGGGREEERERERGEDRESEAAGEIERQRERVREMQRDRVCVWWRNSGLAASLFIHVMECVCLVSMAMDRSARSSSTRW